MAEPMPSHPLSTREKIVLLEGAKLNGWRFPPWTSAPQPEEFTLTNGRPFTDGKLLTLSSQQLLVFEQWSRPSEIWASKEWTPADRSTEPELGHATRPIDLVQDATNDCSLVAGLCAIVGLFERTRHDILASISFPTVGPGTTQRASQNGKYLFKLLINGTFRRVEIDDQLPCAMPGRSLFAVDRANPHLLWPALVEKAYLKIRGGYDCPGSNSGTDVWVLTGWIPEQVFLQRDIVDRDRLWTRIFRAFHQGRVLLTAGTGTMSEHEEDGTGLTGEHDYAILDLRNSNGVRSVLIKNPWTRSTIWTGHTKSGNNMQQPRTEQEMTKLLPGSFWMDLENFCRNFESLYLNWNPNLFSFREDVHCGWEIGDNDYRSISLRSNPQFVVYSERGGVVWILLSRHLETRRNFDAISSRSESVGRGYLSLYAFDNKGDRVLVDNNTIISTPFIDAPNLLIKLEILPKTALTIAVLGQQIKSQKLNLSLAALAINQCDLNIAHQKYIFHRIEEGIWNIAHMPVNSRNDGIRVESRFNLLLSQSSAVYALLESDTEDIPAQIKLLKPRARRQKVQEDIVLGDSGIHHRGPLLVEFHRLEIGTYTIVCLTHQTRTPVRFHLELGTEQAFTIQPAQSENAGHLTSSLQATRLSHHIKQVSARISVCDVSSISAQAYWHPTSSISFQLALEEGRRPFATNLTEIIFAQQDGPQASIGTSTVNVNPKACRERGLYVVIDALMPSDVDRFETLFHVHLVSDAPLIVGPWV